MNDEQYARIEAKREQNRYFRELDQAVIPASTRPVPKKKLVIKAGRSYKTKWDGSIVCKGPCGRPLRGTRMAAAAIPGSVRIWEDGRCKTCARKSKERVRKPMDPCRACDRPMRPNGVGAEEMPGTRAHQGLGLCSSCYKRRTPGGGVRAPQVRTRKRVVEAPRITHDGSTRCIVCDQTLRGRNVKIADAPGTLRVHRRVPAGYVCISCNAREKRQ